MNITNINFKHIKYDSENAELEGLFFSPDKVKNPPFVVYVHGHNTIGAWANIQLAYFLQGIGFASFLPSMRGFGFSGGEPDFCGPKTVKGIVDGIYAVLELDVVDKNKIGIWGASRGATVSSQVITQIPELFKAAVLEAGVYDMKKEYEWEKRDPEIKANMVKETGGSDEAWVERSSILRADKISAPVLILHGDQDKNVNVEQAKLLDAKLTELGKNHETVILAGLDHFITRATRRQYTFPFLEKHLK